MDRHLIETISLLTIITLVITGATLAMTGIDAEDSENTGEVIPNDNSACTLTFYDYAGGSQAESFLVRQGYDIQLPTNMFTRHGYYLSGWTDSNDTFLPGSTMTIEYETVLYGVWSETRGTHLEDQDVTLQLAEPYSVNLFDVSPGTGGLHIVSKPDWLTLDDDGSYVYSGQPDAPGLYYVCFYKMWISNPAYYWFTITVPSEMDTVVTVSFDVGENVTGSIPNEYPRVGTGIVLPGADSLEWSGTGDMNLVGWNITDDRGNRGMYPLDSLYIFDVDTVVEPVWEADPHVLVYSLDGGSLENVYATITYGDEPEPLRTDAVKAGHQFLGWKVSQDQDLVYAPGMLVTLTDTTYLEAYFVPEGTATFTVTYDAGQGSAAIITQKVEAGKYVMLPQYQVQYDGYEFVGWSTEPPSGNGVDDNRATIGSPQYRVMEDVTLYAVYTNPNGDTDPEDPDDPDSDPDPEPNTYTVVFDANGGDVSYPIQHILEGGLVEEPSAPMRDGCIFLGWAVLGTTDPWNFDSDTVEYSITLRAMWDDLFTISYSEDSKGLPVVTVNVSETYKGASSIEVYWGSVRDGTSVVVNGTASHTYEYTTWGYIVLTILWDGTTQTSRLPFSVEAEHYVPVNEYLVTFNTDGGSHVDPQTVKHGEIATKPVPDPTKDGFIFKGWVDSSGEAFDFSTPIYHDTVLRATWTDEPVVDDPDEVVVFFTISQTSTGWKLDGSKSQNVDTLTWLLDDSEIGTGETFDLDSDDVEEGTHTIQLKAVGTDGETYYSDKQNITKGESTEEPVYPTAYFTTEETESGWKFDASESKNVAKYEWYIGGQRLTGEYGRTLEIDADDLNVGTHEVKLIVTSTTGHTNQFTDDITVKAPVEPEEDDIDWVLIACIVLVIIVVAIVIWRFLL